MVSSAKNMVSYHSVPFPNKKKYTKSLYSLFLKEENSKFLLFAGENTSYSTTKKVLFKTYFLDIVMKHAMTLDFVWRKKYLKTVTNSGYLFLKPYKKTYSGNGMKWER